MRSIRKLWDHDARLMTDEKFSVTEEKTVDFEDGHSLDISGENIMDDSITTALDIHSMRKLRGK